MVHIFACLSYADNQPSLKICCEQVLKPPKSTLPSETFLTEHLFAWRVLLIFCLCMLHYLSFWLSDHFAVDQHILHIGGNFKRTTVRDHDIGILSFLQGTYSVSNACMLCWIDGDSL